MKNAVHHVGLDSTHAPSDDEKTIVGVGGRNQLPPDPDAGLSDEEKARIV